MYTLNANVIENSPRVILNPIICIYDVQSLNYIQNPTIWRL